MGAVALGIISIILAFLPVVGVIAIGPATMGLILGVVDIVNKNNKREPMGISIAGTILSVVAIIIAIIWISGYADYVYEATRKEVNNLDSTVNYLYQNNFSER